MANLAFLGLGYLTIENSLIKRTESYFSIINTFSRLTTSFVATIAIGAYRDDKFIMDSHNCVYLAAAYTSLGVVVDSKIIPRIFNAVSGIFKPTALEEPEVDEGAAIRDQLLLEIKSNPKTYKKAIEAVIIAMGYRLDDLEYEAIENIRIATGNAKKEHLTDDAFIERFYESAEQLNI